MTLQPWIPAESGNIYEFELTTAEIPIGSQLVLVGGYNAKTDGKTFRLFIPPIISSAAAAESATIHLVSEPSEGAINLGATVQYQTDRNAAWNSIIRALRGGNRWKESSIRQWLNSDGLANEWWTPQHHWDRPPVTASANGFMHDIDPELKAVVGLTHNITIVNANDGGGYDETDDYFFLPGVKGLYGYADGTRYDLEEAEAYSYFKDYSKLSAPGLGSDANRKKTTSSGSIAGMAQYYWLRSDAGQVHIPWEVRNTNGVINNNGGYYAYWFAVACNIM